MNKSLLFFTLLSVALASGQSKLSVIHPTTGLQESSLIAQPPTPVNMLQRSTMSVILGGVIKSEYTRVPLGQQAQSVYSASIFNNNSEPANVKLRLRVFDPSMTQVALATSVSETIDTFSTTSVLTVTPVFTPSIGTYTFTYDAIVDGYPDTDSAVTYTVQYTDTEMARDNNTPNGGLGIGDGGGYLGNSFTYSSAATLASVSIYQLGPNAASIEMGCAIFKVVAGEPQLVYTVPSQVLPANNPSGWVTYTVDPPLAIAAGDKLVVCAQEYAQTLRVGLTTDIYTAGATYVFWPTSPFSGWAHNENFGGQFAKPYMIRTNLACNIAEPTVNTTQQFCEGAVVSDLVATGTGIQWFADAVGGTALDGTTALATGTYHVSQTDGSCTSDRVAVSVTVDPLTQNTTVVDTCDQYTWAVNGTTYTTSGSYNVTTGCHTEILDLTITPTTVNTTVVDTCDQYTWAVNGTTYTTSGSYDVTVGCHTEILDLTITPTTVNTTVVDTCDQYTWAVNGTTYTTSGSYDVTVGCHTEILDLTITPTTVNSAVVTACDQYTWAVNGTTYTASGSYDVTVGCHTEILELTIQSPPTFSVQPVNASIEEGSPVTFTAVAQNAASYVWQLSTNGGQTWTNLPEGNGITGTNTNTLSISGVLTTLQVNGVMVRVIITNGSCDVTSDEVTLSVFLGLNDVDRNNVVLYPNPTKGYVHVTTNAASAIITVTDLNGRTVHTQRLTEGSGDILISDVQAGVYLFTIATDNGVTHRKVVKQ